MKYAVVESGGKQYIAREGERIDVDRLSVQVGETVELDQVLLGANNGEVSVGAPTISGALVKARVIAQVRGPKVVVFKYKPKIRYRRKQGHRQQYTRLEIDSIDLPAGKATRSKAEAKAKAEPEPQEAPGAVLDYDLNSMKKAELEALATELGVMPEEGSGAGGNVLVQDLKEAIQGYLDKKGS